MNSLSIKRLFVWLLVLVVLPSCEDDVTDLKNLDLAPRLVVNSYISPQDQVLKVKLQQTQPGVGQSKRPEELRITDATVTLSNGSTTVVLAYDPDTDNYQTDAANLPVVAGKSYFLKVNTPSGFKAEATCTVPSVAGITIFDLEHTAAPSDLSPTSKDHTFTYKWTDAPHTENYYRTMAYLVIRQPDFNGELKSQTQPFYLNDDDVKNFTDDRRSPGSNLKAPRYNTYTVAGFGRPNDIEYEVHALLIVADKHYYQYHKSMLDQTYSEGNPFAEPITVISNIKGALGVFGAFNELDTFITVR